MTPRCAIIECYNRHDEVYLTTAHLMNRLGYEVHVFNTARNRLKNSFVHAKKLRRHVHSRMSSAGVLRAAMKQDFDLAIFNTFEGSAVLACARHLIRKCPIFGFVHNGRFISTKPEYKLFVDNERCRFMVLAPYISQYVAGAVDAACMYPVFFHDGEVPRIPYSTGKRRFCVQGYFDSKRRQYSQLIDTLERFRAEGRDDFEVYVMGRTFSQDFTSFDRDVKRKGLASYLRYAWKGIGYRSYYRLLNSVDYILPLVSPNSHPEYFRSKSTSSVAAAIGFGKVPVLHQKLAEFYGVETASFVYADDLHAAMRAALDVSADELVRLQAQVLRIKEDGLEYSLQQMQQSLAQFSPALAEPMRCASFVTAASPGER